MRENSSAFDRGGPGGRDYSTKLPSDHSRSSSGPSRAILSLGDLLRKGTPMQRTLSNSNDLAILSRILEPDKPNLSMEAARALLALEFSQEDKDRMRQLLAKAKEGTLTPDEQAEADS